MLPKNILVISDDLLEERAADDGADDEILAYAMKNHLGFRDDSACVNLYLTRGYGYALIRSPELFDLVWDKIPQFLSAIIMAVQKDTSYGMMENVLKKQLRKHMAIYLLSLVSKRMACRES